MSARSSPPHFVEHVDNNDNNNNNSNASHTTSASSNSQNDNSEAASTLLSRFMASFTACFGAAFAPVAPLATRASDIAHPYYEWVRNRLGEYVRVLRGSALSEPLIDQDGGNDNDRRSSAASTTGGGGDQNAFLGNSAGSASPMTQSEIQGSVFYPPAFPPTIGQDSVMLKSFNEYRPPNIRMEASDLRQPNRNAPSPSLLR